LGSNFTLGTLDADVSPTMVDVTSITARASDRELVWLAILAGLIVTFGSVHLIRLRRKPQ
jgi:hypothetical protein